MNCLKPIWLPETSDRFGQYVPCSKCYNCLQKKRAIWTNRMMQENKDADSGYFITLTYDQENIPLVDCYGIDLGVLHKTDLTNFIKRLRTNVQKYTYESEDWFKKSEKTGKWSPKVRYFACGEYGKYGNRPHYHIILWNLPSDYVEEDVVHGGKYSDLLDMTWSKGIVDVGDVTEASCHYVAKYTLDPLVNNKYKMFGKEIQKPFATMSRNPGIGLNFVTYEIKNHYRDTKVSYSLSDKGHKKPLGRYYKEKIYEDFPEEFKEMQRKCVEYSNKREEIRRERFKADEEFWEDKRIEKEMSDRKIEKIIKESKL